MYAEDIYDMNMLLSEKNSVAMKTKLMKKCVSVSIITNSIKDCLVKRCLQQLSDMTAYVVELGTVTSVICCPIFDDFQHMTFTLIDNYYLTKSQILFQ